MFTDAKKNTVYVNSERMRGSAPQAAKHIEDALCIASNTQSPK